MSDHEKSCYGIRWHQERDWEELAGVSYHRRSQHEEVQSMCDWLLQLFES